MTHYIVDYSELSEEDKAAKAIEDIKEFLGLERFNKIEAMFIGRKPMSRMNFVMSISLAGISGLPAHVWYERLMPATYDMHEYTWLTS